MAMGDNTTDRHGVDHGPFSNLRCKDLSKRSLTVVEKRWLGSQILMRKASASELSTRYQLPKSQIYNYSRRGRVLRDKSGRPASLDVVGKVEFIDELIINRVNTAPEVREYVQQHARRKICESNIRAGCNGLAQVCDRTVTRICNNLAIERSKVQVALEREEPRMRRRSARWRQRHFSQRRKREVKVCSSRG